MRPLRDVARGWQTQSLLFARETVPPEMRNIFGQKRQLVPALGNRKSDVRQGRPLIVSNTGAPSTSNSSLMVSFGPTLPRMMEGGPSGLVGPRA